MTFTQLAAEQRISFTDLAHREGVSLSTVWRWSLRGCRGYRLESLNVGSRKVTTLPAYERFLAAINGEPAPAPATPSQRKRALEAADKEIAAGGLLTRGP